MHISDCLVPEGEIEIEIESESDREANIEIESGFLLFRLQCFLIRSFILYFSIQVFDIWRVRMEA